MSELKENESCLNTLVVPKTVFENYPNLKNSPWGPQKSKMTQMLSQNQMSELRETKKKKIIKLHEYTKKQLLNPTQTRKIAH